MDSTLFVLHSNDMAKPPVMRIRVTNDTQRAEAEDGESESYNEEELAALKQLEFHLLNQVRPCCWFCCSCCCCCHCCCLFFCCCRR